MRYVFLSLAVLLILRVYMVREILAALLVFATIFGAILALTAVGWLMQSLGVPAITWSEVWLRGLRTTGARGALSFRNVAKVPARSDNVP